MANSRDTSGPEITGHLELVYPSKYVKACDLKGKDVTVVITSIRWEGLVMQGGARDRKACITMETVSGKPLEKKWVVGKTVLREIGGATGETMIQDFKGKRVTMYPTKCKGKEGKQVECIRVRVKTARTNEEPPEEFAAPVDPKEFLDEAESDNVREPGDDA